MSERGFIESLSDILEAIKRIRIFTSGMDYEAFMDDIKTRDAVVRNFEIIGEASKSIKNDFREKYTGVPWKEMAGMRDKLIHHYFGVNYEIVWTIIHEELSPVFDSINRILLQGEA
jgi:uncharacterized protein with HEPN domain